MKKLLIIAIIIICVVSLFGGTPRTYTQQIVTDVANGAPDILTIVTNSSSSTCPSYLATAQIVETGETLTTGIAPVTTLNISKLGTRARLVLQLGSFPTQWLAGQTLRCTVTYIEPGEHYGEYTTWDMIIPPGTTTWTVYDPVQLVPPLPPSNHIISGMITSQWDLTGVTISATDIDPANITYDAGAYTVTVPDGWDGVITPAKDGYIFEPASRTYTDVTADTPNQDFVMKTVVVPGVPTNLAPNDITLTYTEPTAVTLSWVAPADVNVDSYKLIWNNGEVQNIGNVLNWTTPALDAGTYTWKVCAVNNTPTKNYTPVRVQINGRSTAGTNNPKADGAWAEASFTVAIAPAEYNVNITSNPTGVAIYVDGTNSGEFTPHTFIMAAGASATYTVVMDHYTWNPTEFVVTNISENMSCNFVGTPYYDIPDGVPTTPTGATVTVTITITGGNANYGSGVLPPWVNPSFTPIEQYFLSLIGTGPWTITFNTTAPWAAYFLGGIWHAVQNTGLAITFTIDVSKDVPNVPVVLGNEDPTLPVELSYFAATLTAENFVNIAWTTQTETNMNGFNIYRNDGSDNLASANRIAYIPATNTSTTQNYNLLDREVEIGHTYYYWLECVEISGHSTFNGPYPIYVNGPTPPVLPEYTKMHNAYPNPFRAGSGTTIAVEVKKGDSGTVTIYNILGQVVKTFSLTEGTNNLNWNGRDSKGNLCGNGIYFYKLSTNSLNQTKKMVIVK